MKGKKTGGRQKGTRNKVTEANVAIASAEEQPLEVMLDNMRVAYRKAKDVEAAIIPAMISGLPLEQSFDAIRREVERSLNLRAVAQVCAREAAPFCHPKLSATVHSGKLTLEMLVQASYGSPPPPPQDPQLNGKAPQLIEAKANGHATKANGSKDS